MLLLIELPGQYWESYADLSWTNTRQLFQFFSSMYTQNLLLAKYASLFCHELLNWSTFVLS